MLSRRSLLAGVVALPGLPKTDRLEFRLIREGSRIGSHVLEFEARGNGVVVSIAVDIEVRFGPFVLYRYKLRGAETWEDGRCIAAESQTNDDGRPCFMRATRGPGGLRVEGNGTPSYTAPANALVASHWNRAELDGPWINLQDGQLLHPRVAPLGPRPAVLANGARVPASCFAITGPARIWLWYSSADVWTGLEFEAKDGSRVRYERMT